MTVIHKNENYLYLDKSGNIQQHKGVKMDGSPTAASLKELKAKAYQCYQTLIGQNEYKFHDENERNRVISCLKHVNIINGKIDSFYDKLSERFSCFAWLFSIVKRLKRLDTPQLEGLARKYLAVEFLPKKLSLPN